MVLAKLFRPWRDSVPTAVELRSADFSPPPLGTCKSAGSGMNSALQVCRNWLNSTAVGVRGGLVGARFKGREQQPSDWRVVRAGDRWPELDRRIALLSEISVFTEIHLQKNFSRPDRGP